MRSCLRRGTGFDPAIHYVRDLYPLCTYSGDHNDRGQEELLLFQILLYDLPIDFGKPAGIMNGIFGDELHQPLLCNDLCSVWQDSALQFLLYHPLPNGVGAVPDQRSDTLRCQRIWHFPPYFVEESLKVINADLGNGICMFFLAVEQTDRSSHRFRCCFQRPKVSDHIVDANLIAAGFLSAVLAGDVSTIQQPLCLALADVADPVQLVCAYDFGIFLIEERKE